MQQSKARSKDSKARTPLYQRNTNSSHQKKVKSKRQTQINLKEGRSENFQPSIDNMSSSQSFMPRTTRAQRDLSKNSGKVQQTHSRKVSQKNTETSEELRPSHKVKNFDEYIRDITNQRDSSIESSKSCAAKQIVLQKQSVPYQQVLQQKIAQIQSSQNQNFEVESLGRSTQSMAIHSEKSSPLKAPNIARFVDGQPVDSSTKKSMYQSNILTSPNMFQTSPQHQTNLVLKSDMSNLVQQYQQMNNEVKRTNPFFTTIKSSSGCNQAFNSSERVSPINQKSSTKRKCKQAPLLNITSPSLLKLTKSFAQKKVQKYSSRESSLSQRSMLSGQQHTGDLRRPSPRNCMLKFEHLVRFQDQKAIQYRASSQSIMSCRNVTRTIDDTVSASSFNKTVSTHRCQPEQDGKSQQSKRPHKILFEDTLEMSDQNLLAKVRRNVNRSQSNSLLNQSPGASVRVAKGRQNINKKFFQPLTLKRLNQPSCNKLLKEQHLAITELNNEMGGMKHKLAQTKRKITLSHNEQKMLLEMMDSMHKFDRNRCERNHQQQLREHDTQQSVTQMEAKVKGQERQAKLLTDESSANDAMILQLQSMVNQLTRNLHSVCKEKTELTQACVVSSRKVESIQQTKEQLTTEKQVIATEFTNQKHLKS